MRRAQATARTTGRNIERSMTGMSLRTSQAFAGLRVAAAGMGVALGAGLLINQARAAFEFASGLTEAARSIGVTVEQLQVLRRAALENGASVEGMERAMAILNRTLGQARAGVPAAAQAFRALRIDPEQFTSAGQVLPAIMDKIRTLRTVSEQAAAAQRLMGRGAAEMIPFLVQGSGALSRLTEEMRRTGLVTEEQARRADEAEDSLRRLGDVIRINLASALADVIPYAESLVRTLRDLGNMAGWALGQINSIASGVGVPRQMMNTVGSLAMGPLGPLVSAYQSLRGTGRRSLGTTASRVGAPATAPVPSDTGGTDLDLSPSGGRGSRSRSNAAEQAIRRRHEIESEFNRARVEELRSQQELTQDAAQRNEYAQMISYLEQQQAEAEITLARLLKQRTVAEGDALADVQTRTFHNQRQAADEAEAQRIAAERVEVAHGGLDLALDLARGEADLADTTDERREAQLRILGYEQQQERAAIEAVLASRDATNAQKQIAQARLDMLSSIYQQREQGVMNANRGPLGDFLAELPTTAARANEALQRIAADGLSAVTDGLANALLHVRSLGDGFKALRNIALSVLEDLLRMQIQRSFTAPAANFLSTLFSSGGGGGSGGSSFFSSLFSSLQGRASGGPVTPGRTYLIGEKGPELLHMGGHGQVISNDNMRGAGGHVVIELRDELLDARIVRGSVEVVRAAAPSLMKGAAADTIRQIRRPRL